MITIDTTRYSKVVAAFVDRYPDAAIKLDKRVPTDPASRWCTNARLLGAINFSLLRGKTELLGFHDGPCNMWASAEALPLVEELAAQQLLRFKVLAPRPPSLISRLFGRGNGV
nr:putative integron gene cassette protein [uncultured bacterium]